MSTSFTILLDHPDFLVIAKPAGMAMHEAKHISKSATLIHHLRIFLHGKDASERQKEEMVHRLDQDSSGCVLISKNPQTTKTFETMFKAGEVRKEYEVLVLGALKTPLGVLSTPLPGRGKEKVQAITEYQLIRKFPEYACSFVRAFPKTGRKHQIRLHFKLIGHPVVMDQVHGHFAKNKEFRKQFGLKRQFLHASKISFLWKGELIKVFCPLPEDLQSTLKKLGEQA